MPLKHHFITNSGAFAQITFVILDSLNHAVPFRMVQFSSATSSCLLITHAFCQTLNLSLNRCVLFFPAANAQCLAANESNMWFQHRCWQINGKSSSPLRCNSNSFGFSMQIFYALVLSVRCSGNGFPNHWLFQFLCP